MVDDIKQLHLLKNLTNQMPMGVAEFSPDLILRHCNPAWVNFFKEYASFPFQQVTPGKHLFELLSNTEPLLHPILEQVKTGQTIQKKEFSLKSGGITTYWDMVFTPYLEEGQVTGIVNLAIDVTDRKRAEERRQEAERRRRVAESLRDILTVLNSNRPLDEILDYIVAQACHLLGPDAAAIYKLHPAERVLTVQASAGLPPVYMDLKIPIEFSLAATAIETMQPIVFTDVDKHQDDPVVTEKLTPAQHETLDRIARQFKAIIGVPLIIRDEIYGGITLHYSDTRQFTKEEIDLAVSFADQAALAIENARLRSQAEQAAATAERTRLARDLHDAVTQTLFSTSLIAEVLPRLWERNRPEAERRLEELRQLTRGALAEMRTLLLELRPSALEEANLSELLRQLTEAITGRGRIPIKFTTTGQAALPAPVKLAFYRIAQESLNNVIKHAGAGQVDVTLTLIDTPAPTAKLCISDDGAGFVSASTPPEHMGLKIMSERAEAAGAELTVESHPGQGTKIIIDWTADKGL